MKNYEPLFVKVLAQYGLGSCYCSCKMAPIYFSWHYRSKLHIFKIMQHSCLLLVGLGIGGIMLDFKPSSTKIAFSQPNVTQS